MAGAIYSGWERQVSSLRRTRSVQLKRAASCKLLLRCCNRAPAMSNRLDESHHVRSRQHAKRPLPRSQTVKHAHAPYASIPIPLCTPDRSCRSGNELHPIETVRSTRTSTCGRAGAPSPMGARGPAEPLQGECAPPHTRGSACSACRARPRARPASGLERPSAILARLLALPRRRPSLAFSVPHPPLSKTTFL